MISAGAHALTRAPTRALTRALTRTPTHTTTINRKGVFEVRHNTL